MKPKLIAITGASLALIGIFIAGMGIGMNARYDGQGSGTRLTWIGIAITFVFALGTIFFSIQQAKKTKDNSDRQ